MFFLSKIFNSIKEYNILKTILFNFKVFPVKTACKLPIKVGYRTQIVGSYRGCFSFAEGIIPKRFMFTLGCTKWPEFAPKGLWNYLRFSEGGKIVIGGRAEIDNGVSLVAVMGGVIHIGNGIRINEGSLVYACNCVRINDFCRIGWKCQIMDSNHHLILKESAEKINSPVSPIELGHNCWLASNVSVMRGVRLPPFSIVSAGSVVSRVESEDEACIYTGNPAKIISKGYKRILNTKLERTVKDMFKNSGERSIIVKYSEDSITLDGVSYNKLFEC